MNGHVARGGRAADTDTGRGRGEVVSRPGRLGGGKKLDRLDQILDLRGGDVAEVLEAGAQKAGGVDEEAAAAAVLEVGIEDRLARGHRGLGDLVPTVHLVDEVAVDRQLGILFEDGLGLLHTGGESGDDLQPRHAVEQLAVYPVHDRDEVEALVRPVRVLLLRPMQSVDDPQAELLGTGEMPRRVRSAGELGNTGQPRGSGAGGAAGQELATAEARVVDTADGKVGRGFGSAHARLLEWLSGGEIPPNICRGSALVKEPGRSNPGFSAASVCGG